LPSNAVSDNVQQNHDNIAEMCSVGSDDDKEPETENIFDESSSDEDNPNANDLNAIMRERTLYFCLELYAMKTQPRKNVISIVNSTSALVADILAELQKEIVSECALQNAPGIAEFTKTLFQSACSSSSGLTSDYLARKSL